MAKAVAWSVTDAEARKRGEQIGLDLSLIHISPSVKTTPLLYKPFTPQPNKYLRLNKPIIDQVLDHDALLFYPFHDMEPFLLLLKEAAENPEVKSIKITIYRLANHSRIAVSYTHLDVYKRQILACAFLYAAMYILMMLVIDVSYGIIDPRIRLGKDE